MPVELTGTGLPARRPQRVIVTGLASDAHTWNLVFIQLFIEELGFEVTNLGPTVPDDLMVSECVDYKPALIVISSVNGHGYQDGLRVVERLREHPELTGIPVVIGGKLGISGALSDQQIPTLMNAGYSAVFDDRPEGLAGFRRFLDAIPHKVLT
jgi:methylaspartate mutase sigma subunit